jgi:hypothetical protein
MARAPEQRPVDGGSKKRKRQEEDDKQKRKSEKSENRRSSGEILRYTIGSPNLMILPRFDGVVVVTPSHKSSNKFTDTKAARIYRVSWNKCLERLQMIIRTTLAIGDTNDNMKSSVYKSEREPHVADKRNLRAIDKGLLALTVENVKINIYATK